MPTIKGNLMFVSTRAAQVSEVWVRAPQVRTHVDGVVTTGNDRFPVKDGEVSFTAVPGPAVLALISQGRAVDTIPILVGDAATQTLRQVVSAAKIADDATQREIEKLAAQAVELVDSSTANARKAQDGASRAETAAGNAKRSESSASSSASAAKSSASAASSSASKAATSERNARESASSAKSDADRTANIAGSTSWNGDKLTVNGKTSPSLRGPKGDPGDVSKSQLDTAIASEKARTVGMVWMVETEDAAKAKLSSAQAGDHIQVSATGNVYRLAQEGGVLTLKLVKSPITEIPGLVDFNTFTTTGVWHQGSYNNAQSSKNTPNNLPGLLEVFAASGTIYQRFTTYRGGDVYVRGYYAYADIWSDWRTLTN